MRTALVAITMMLLATPLAAMAFPFGGQIDLYKQCYNRAIYANLGPPRGGPYIWTETTKTYQFGPPSHAGQWLLGLASAPYYCIFSISPLDVRPGTAITMMGSSGPSAPAYTPPPQPTPPVPSPSPTPYDWGPYCRDRVPETGVPPWWNGTPPTVDPCIDLTKNLTCEQVRAQGYKLITRCGT